MKAIVKFAVSTVLLYIAGVAAFTYNTRLLFVGEYVTAILFLFAVYTAYKVTTRDYVTVKEIAAVAAIAYLLAFPLDWLVKNTAVPDATSWSGFALHAVLGFLILLVALVVTRRGSKLLNQLPLHA